MLSVGIPSIFSLWGKLSIRLDRMGRNVEFISTTQELVDIMNDITKELVMLGALTVSQLLCRRVLYNSFCHILG